MKKLTKQQQILIGLVLGFFGIIYVYWNYLLKPTLQVITEREATYRDLVQRVQTAEAQARRLPQLQAELAALETQLVTLEKQLPTQKDVPGILRIVTREAQDQNLSFQSLTPLEPKKETYFEVLSFDVAMNGSLHSFVRFVTSLGQQERIFQFERVNIMMGGVVENQPGVINLNITFSLKTYAYVG